MAQCNCALVILAHNGVEFTERCVRSVLGAADLPTELFLIDNGSTDATPELLRCLAPQVTGAGVRFHTWRNAENKGCSAARNEAWAKVTAPCTLFMDNDTAVCTRDWLSRLERRMAADASLGILGPKLIYPYAPHPIQCAGVSISRMGRIAFMGRGSPRHDPRYAEARRVHALISACWIMRTDLRERVGYLDELFHPVQYEDLDLCLRAEAASLANQYTPEVEIYHFEGITTASFGAQAYRGTIARNSQKFRERWHGRFKTFTDELAPEDYRWLPRNELGLTPVLDLAYCTSPGAGACEEHVGRKRGRT
jgi:GT2 family glycosyltransferase